VLFRQKIYIKKDHEKHYTAVVLISQKRSKRVRPYIILIHHLLISLCTRIIDGLVRYEEYYFFLSVPPFSNYPSVPGKEPPYCCRTPRNREPSVLPAIIVPRYVVSVLLSGPMYTSYMCTLDTMMVHSGHRVSPCTLPVTFKLNPRFQASDRCNFCY